MIMAAIANALADDAMQHAFIDGPIEAAIRPLIAREEFTAGPSRGPPPTAVATTASRDRPLDHPMEELRRIYFDHLEIGLQPAHGARADEDLERARLDHELHPVGRRTRGRPA